MNLKLMLEGTAGRYGDKDAIVFDDRRISYSELDEASNRLANSLITLGIRKGDRIAILLSNSPEFIVTLFGIAKTGAIAVPLDPRYRIGELTYLFNDCLPIALVAESSILGPLVPFVPKIKSIKHVIDVGSEYKGQFLGYQEILAAGTTQKINSEIASDDISLIMYTSSSSFHPRGAMLSHRSLVMEAAMSVDGYQQTHKDVMMLFALPMYHVFGMVAAVLGSIYRGSTVVIVPGTGLSINSFLAAVEREKGTMFLGVPYIFALAVDTAEKEGIKHDLSSLRLCASAGAPLSVDTVKQFKKLYGFDIVDCYGLTEAICHVTCSSLNGRGKLGSVGKALPGWKVKIVDGNGREMPSDVAGEMVVSGPIMRGYYNKSQATGEAIKNGWLYTGDIGKADKEGNLFVTGRKKDTIIVKGQNISPGDIESALSMHPKVAEVAVIGIPDKMRGEVIGAIISLKEGAVATEQEIRQFCLDRIASYKAPKQVVFLKSLPRTSNGEIDKETIRQQLSIPPLFPEAVNFK
jgi:long-chain acyl-CoA synthetase